jgi:hypothetical protein
MDANFNVEDKRVRLAFEGRYMFVGSAEEYACATYEISPAEIALFAPVSAAPGTNVILYLKELGRFSGPVVRTTEIGFLMALKLTPQRRDKLAGMLAWRNNLAAMEVEERRSRVRFAPLHEITILRLAKGRECVARILSLSLSGAEIETEEPISVGSDIMIGATPATVVRLSDTGFGCQFLREFSPGEIDETTRL